MKASSISALFVSPLALPASAAGEIRNNLNASVTGTDLAARGSLPLAIGTLVTAFLGLLSLVFFILMLYGGWKWMTARGDTKVVTDAKNIIIAAITGLVIIVLSYAITIFIFNGVSAS